MSEPVLVSLHVYPLKSVRGHAPQQAAVEPWGLAGDRRWMLVDAADRVVTQRQHARLALAGASALPGGGLRLTAPGRDPLDVAVPASGETVMTELFGSKVELAPAAPRAHAWFSAYLGADTRLVHLDRPAERRPVDPAYARPGETVSLADGYPLLVTSADSLDDLNSLVAQGDRAEEGPLPMNRFRPNLVVRGAPAWAEDDWARIAVGEVSFRVTKPCARCVVTTTDQVTAVRGREPLRTLARHRRFGERLLFGQNLVPETTGTVRVGDTVTVLERAGSSAAARPHGDPGGAV
jgi:uncharacterized protein